MATFEQAPPALGAVAATRAGGSSHAFTAPGAARQPAFGGKKWAMLEWGQLAGALHANAPADRRAREGSVRCAGRS